MAVKFHTGLVFRTIFFPFYFFLVPFNVLGNDELLSIWKNLRQLLSQRTYPPQSLSFLKLEATPFHTFRISFDFLNSRQRIQLQRKWQLSPKLQSYQRMVLWRLHLTAVLLTYNFFFSLIPSPFWEEEARARWTEYLGFIVVNCNGELGTLCDE